MNKIKLVSIAAGLVAIAGLGWAQNSGPDGTGFVRNTNETIKWVDYPGDGAQFGIKEAFLLGDPTKPGLYVIRLKFPPGVMSSPHSHSETRFGTVISGTWYTGTGEKFDPASTTGIPTGGTMIHPAGKVHYDGARKEEAIVQMIGVGPTSKTTVTPGAPGFIKFTP